MRGCGFCAEAEERAAQGGGPYGLRMPEPVSLLRGGEAPGH